MEKNRAKDNKMTGRRRQRPTNRQQAVTENWRAERGRLDSNHSRTEIAPETGLRQHLDHSQHSGKAHYENTRAAQATSATPASLLAMKTPRPHPRPTASEALGVSHAYFQKPAGLFWCSLRCENCRSKGLCRIQFRAWVGLRRNYCCTDKQYQSLPKPTVSSHTYPDR